MRSFFVALLLLPVFAIAAPVRVQSAKANSGGVTMTSINLTFSSAPTAGNILVIAVATNSNAPIVAPSGSLSVMSNTVVAANATWLTTIVCKVFSGASSTVTITIQSSTAIAAVGAEYSGVSGLVDRQAVAIGSSTSPASGATSTTSSANQLWIGAIAFRSGLTFSLPTGGFTTIDQDKSTLSTANDRGVVLAEQIVTSTGTPAFGGTLSASNNWAAGVSALEISNPGSGAGRRPQVRTP